MISHLRGGLQGGRYLPPHHAHAGEVEGGLPLPCQGRGIGRVPVHGGDKEIQPEPSETGELVGTIEADPGQEVPVEAAYRLRGMDTWLQALGQYVNSAPSAISPSLSCGN